MTEEAKSGSTETVETLEKKKQKAGLNAVRPSDFIENAFKTMAKERGISQTDLFEAIFKSYLRKEEDDKLDTELNLNSEIGMIAIGMKNVTKYFEEAIRKAQLIVGQERENASVAQKLNETKIDTLEKRIQEVEKRNVELEQSNAAFTSIEDNLKQQVFELRAEVIKSKQDLSQINDTAARYVKEINVLKENIKKLTKENEKLEDEVDVSRKRISSLEHSNVGLNDTINGFETLKKAEIQAIESKLKAELQEKESKLNIKINDLEDKVKKADMKEKTALEVLEKRLRIEYESDKKLAIAELKVELADSKGKYQETLLQLNKSETKYQEVVAELNQLKNKITSIEKIDKKK